MDARFWGLGDSLRMFGVLMGVRSWGDSGVLGF